MASGRTISVRKLTKKDKSVLELCEKISEIIKDELSDEKRESFWTDFGKIHLTRDAGSGRSGGKLQRDALCTPGKGGKNPLSNRNLRWHPLVVANSPSDRFKNCDFRVDNEEKTIFIIINNEEWLPEDIYKLPEPYCISLESWNSYSEVLKEWKMEDWNQNNMTILASDYSPWYDALETYAILGIICGSSFFDGNLEVLYKKVTEFLASIKTDDINLPSEKFPSCNDNLLLCPVCRAPINGTVANMDRLIKEKSWKAPWKTKKKTTSDSELWTFHMDPLIESEGRHNAQNVRFGHRWCANSKLDHKIDYFLQYMKEVLKNHGM